ncbi:MAG: hypothetical protein RIB60_06020 [Phycisphaerales bacterium]
MSETPVTKSVVKSKTMWGIGAAMIAAIVNEQPGIFQWVSEHVSDPTAATYVAFGFGVVLAVIGRLDAKSKVTITGKG